MPWQATLPGKGGKFDTLIRNRSQHREPRVVPVTRRMEIFRIVISVLFSLCILVLGRTASAQISQVEDLGYVPADTCSQCHEDQARHWSNSDHAWAMKPADESAVLGNFDDAQFDDGAVQARFFRRDEGFWVSIEGETGEMEEFPIAYTFGYFPLQQYLVRLSRGRLQSLTVAWDSRPQEEGGQRWFSLYPGEKFAPDDALHWTGRYQNWNAMCADCHSTFLSMNYDAKTDSFATTWQEQNVGCQGCHGPGRKHVEWAQGDLSASADKPDAKGMGLTVDFKGMDSNKVVETCAYCHSRRQSLKDGQHAHEAYLDKALPSTLGAGLYHPDGQIEGEVYVYGSFVQSAMYKAGVACLDCHDPHTTEVLAQGNTLCTRCHNEAPPPRFPQILAMNYDSPEHHKHPQGSSGAQCVNCHMPETTFMVVDPRRDHSLRIPRPDLTLTTGSPNACNACHDDRSAEWASTAIEQWYPSAERSPHFASALNAFRNGEDDAIVRLARLIRDSTAPAIARATAAENLGSFSYQAFPVLRAGLLSDEPLVQAYAAGAFAQQASGDNLALLIDLLSPDHPRAVRDQALKSLAGVPLNQFPEPVRDRVAQLRADYEKRLAELATLPGSRFNLAAYLHRDGQHDRAIEQYQAALELDPVFSPARINLAKLASERGSAELAVATLTTGADMDRIPNSDRAYLAYLLALVLVESGQNEQALSRFEQATRLNPENTRAAYNQGLVLARMKQWERAGEVLQQALSRAPDDFDLLNAQVFVLFEQGRLDEALGFARTLQSAHPEDARAENLVRELERRLNNGRP